MQLHTYIHSFSVSFSIIINDKISKYSPYAIQLLLLLSRSVVSDSLWPHGPQHSRPPCPSPTPGVYSNSYPLSRWCHPTISSSVVPFSRLQSFPASGSFQMSQCFASGAQSIGVSASTTVLPMNIQDWFQGSYHFLNEFQVTNWMNWVNGKQSDYQRWLLLRRLSSSWSSS